MADLNTQHIDLDLDWTAELDDHPHAGAPSEEDWTAWAIYFADLGTREALERSALDH